MTVLITGCASNPAPTQAKPKPASPSRDLIHVVASGDRLSDIALRYTGRASLWRPIAQYNGITNPRSLKIGDKVAIPKRLLSASYLTIENTRKTPSTKLGSRPQPSPMPAGPLAVQRAVQPTAAPSKSSNVGSEDVLLEPVKINRSFQLEPLGKASLRSVSNTSDGSTKVKVIGSYYPKGIYSQPANYSSLMMRAAPGTLFDVEGVVNDWYKISTHKGVGYLRTDDGQLLSNQ